MSDPTDIQGLEERVAAMRRLGVTKWGDIELGAQPATEAKAEIQSRTPEQAERERRLEQRRTFLAASARLVPRLGEDI